LSAKVQETCSIHKRRSPSEPCPRLVAVIRHRRPNPGNDVIIFYIFSPKNGEKIGVFTQNKAKLRQFPTHFLHENGQNRAFWYILSHFGIMHQEKSGNHD
jgi:hypothetical protein